MAYKLSVVIPSRNELFLKNTVEDLLAHTSDQTEIIVGLDGQWSDPPLEDNNRVKIIYVAESIGQRAMMNLCVKASTAKYVCKVDAHCSFDQDWDVKMLEAFSRAGDDVTMVSIMRNHYAFDWVCPDGHRRYQGPSGPCKEPGCNKTTSRDIVWIGKPSPQSTSYCFDSTPHFQYFRDYTKRPEYRESLNKTGLTETMSLQGSCLMMTREKYWELNICDEAFGSWGSMGIEVAVKTWLSGGRVLVNHKTWYSHMFRTQGSDFGFPYPISGRRVAKAKKMAGEIFFGNKWPGQIKPLSWLLERFWPVQGWTEEQLAVAKKAGMDFVGSKSADILPATSPDTTEQEIINEKAIIYYTDNRLKLKVAHAVQDQLNSTRLPIISVSLKPMPHFGHNIHLKLQRGYLAMFKQILAGLEASTAEYVFLCEHDVLYHPSHFDFIPPTRDKFYYNVNWWRVRLSDGFAASWEANQVSGLCADRKLLLEHYRKRVAIVETYGYHSRMGFEPGSHNDPAQYGYRERSSICPEAYIDDVMAESWKSPEPNVDIKHGNNLSKNKWSLNDFRDKKTAVNFRTGSCPDWAKSIVDKMNR